MNFSNIEDGPDFISIEENYRRDPKNDDPEYLEQMSLRITPWIRNSSKIFDFHLRLHTELIEFFCYIKPSKDQIKIRSKVTDEFKDFIKV